VTLQEFSTGKGALDLSSEGVVSAFLAVGSLEDGISELALSMWPASQQSGIGNVSVTGFPRIVSRGTCDAPP